MKAFVITIMDLPQSVGAAERCIKTGKKHGVEVEMWKATTPKDDPFAVLESRGFPPIGFKKDTKYSRELPCVAAFCSHSGLWMRSATLGEPLLILEHDAVFRTTLPKQLAEFEGICNLGRPSFGKFNTPAPGFTPYAAKDGGYLGGAHAYYVSPQGAKALVAKAHARAGPTDLFITTDDLEVMDYFPWPVVCEDSFSTIQKPEGCKAKHREVLPL